MRTPTPGAPLALLSLFVAACTAPAATPPTGEFGAEGVGYGNPGHAAHVAAIDEIMMAPIRDGLIAGASVAVVYQGEPVAFRGYGWANLQLSVPTPEDAIYEMGSVTKQFTTAALLQAQEEGLVDLDADMSTYLPDFPTQGNRITVRELLDHTSGIRGYTEMEAARPYFVRRVPRDSLLALVAAHPFDFSTGEHEIYNNSAYYLAGVILEQVTGMTYEEYVEERLFAELGMERSRYCSETEIQEGKVNGYDAGQDGLRNKGFIVHNVPFAAGSLCSSARDLATWLGALHGGEVLTDESYAQMIEPGDLNDGTRTRYALGLATNDILGHKALQHGGGIDGFLSQSLYLTEEDLAVVVLVNTTGPPGPAVLAEEIVKLMVGDATPEGMSFDGDLAYFEGTYAGPARAGRIGIRIAADDGALTATTVMVSDRDIPGDRQEAETLEYLGEMTFRSGDVLFTFEGDGDSASVLRWDAVSGYTVMTRQ
ncbi:MAG: serine hydrolase [Gemmatimonadetes bacterium]|nr:serine hydrolase [Gemmatimonadota bacterium]